MVHIWAWTIIMSQKQIQSDRGGGGGKPHTLATRNHFLFKTKNATPKAYYADSRGLWKSTSNAWLRLNHHHHMQDFSSQLTPKRID